VLGCLTFEWGWGWRWPCFGGSLTAFLCEWCCSLANYCSRNLNKKSSEVFIRAGSPPASLSFKGQVTKQATVKWSIKKKVRVDINIINKFYQNVQRQTSRHLYFYNKLNLTGRSTWLDLNSVVPNHFMPHLPTFSLPWVGFHKLYLNNAALGRWFRSWERIVQPKRTPINTWLE